MLNRRAQHLRCEIGLALLVILALATPRSLLAAEPRHLDPAVAGRLEAAVTQGGSLELRDGHVDVATARLHVCQGAATCADVTLGDPLSPSAGSQQPSCADTTAGAWCVRYAGPPPPFAAELEKRLSTMPAAAVWQATPEKRAAPILNSATVLRPPVNHTSPWSLPLAFAELLAPIAAGWLIDRRARRRRKARVWALLVAACIVATGGVIVAYVPVVGLWDFLVISMLLIASALHFAQLAGIARAHVRVALALLLLLALAELAARVWQPAPLPSAPPPQTALLPADLEHSVGLTLDPTAVCAELFESPTATEDPPRGKRLVLVLGDEAIAGRALPPPQRMHKELQLGADVTAVDRTVLDTSLDAEYLLAAREIPRLHPAMIVLFPNDANAFDELGRVRACCGRTPLLDLTTDATPAALCTDTAEAKFPDELAAYVQLSPWPLTLRVFASYSKVLHELDRALDALRLRVSGLQPLDAGTRRAQYARLLRQLKALTDAQHVRLVVVGLPTRGQESVPRAKDSPLGLARAAGLDVLDPSERFADALRNHEPLYLQGDDAGQLSAVGHHMLANWLSPQLVERLPKK